MTLRTCNQQYFHLSSGLGIRSFVTLFERGDRSNKQKERIVLFTFSNTRLFTLFKDDSLFLRVGKLKTGLKNLYHTFWLRYYNNKREWIALFKRAKRAICSFLSKNEWFSQRTKEQIPNHAAIHYIQYFLLITWKHTYTLTQPRLKEFLAAKADFLW